MDLMTSPDQDQIVDAARAFLTNELPVQYQRWEHGAEQAADRRLAAEFAGLGWIGMGVAEADGGVGFSAVEEMLLFREAGRFMVSPMFLASVIGAKVAVAAKAAELAGSIIEGRLTCGIGIRATTGEAYLIDAAGADLVLLVSASQLSLVPTEALGKIRALRGVDRTVTLQAASWPAHGAATVSGDEAAEIILHLSLFIAAALTGAAEAVRDLSVAHASDRVQFGQKIGTFQAVSHPCADMALRCEAAVSQVKMAAITLRDGRTDREFQVRAARIVALNAALANASASVQLHGGMGFAAEYPVQFFLKRAHLLDQIGGAMAAQLDGFLRLSYPAYGASE
jgi:alkylation response protein AidB-like acyl-CoA dehydrogenase